MDTKNKLIDVYQKMSDLTSPECASVCVIPHSCCSPEYCHMTIQIAKEDWNVELSSTDHPTLPLMGPNGCTAAPHLRPICTVHACQVNSLGCKPNDLKWTKMYFKLRSNIDKLKWKLRK